MCTQYSPSLGEHAKGDAPALARPLNGSDKAPWRLEGGLMKFKKWTELLPDDVAGTSHECVWDTIEGPCYQQET